MKNFTPTTINCFSVLGAFVLFCNTLAVNAQQLSATVTQTINTICNGADCDYSGPSILINEIMCSPSQHDGCLSGIGGVETCRGEWIELYNPNLCQPIDISCYYLGATTPGTLSPDREAFLIPQGTILPPGGFCFIRGENAPAVASNLLVQNGGNVVEIVMPGAINGDGMCVQAGALGTPTRFWFPNAAGGWFAFYDRDGIPQDCVYWGSTPTSGQPCIPTRTGCNNNVTSLSDFNGIPANRKTQILTTSVPDSWGKSFRRMPDGGAWEVVGNTGTYAGVPTPGYCNDVCATVGSSSCDGTATVTVTGGQAPYTYQWNDSQGQLTATANGLCAGTYQCIVRDALGETTTVSVTISDFVPTVTVDITPEVCIDNPTVSITVSPTAQGGATSLLTGTGVTGTNFNPATAGAGSHTITYQYEDENGCQNSATTSITVNPLPTVAIANTDPFCSDLTNGSIPLTPATGGTLTGPGVSNNEFNPSVAGVGTHTLNYTFTDANGCTNSTTNDVTVVEAATPTLTGPTDACVDAPAVTFDGQPSNGQFFVDGTVTNTTFLPSSVGVGTHALIYSYTDANGCSGSTTGTFIVNDLPNINLSLGTYCYETGFHPINPTPAGGTLTGDNLVGNGIDLNGVAPGTYSVSYEVTDANGCYNSTNEDYLVTSPITPSYDYSVDCFQKMAAIAQPVNQSYTYTWNYGNGPIVLSTPNFVHVFEEYGTMPLQLTITDGYGCAYDTVVVVDVPKGASFEDFQIPNVITPNGDGVNDYFEMPLLLDNCFTYKILITNRWGNVVYEMKNQDSRFDGFTKNGNEIPDGVYFYNFFSDDFDCSDPAIKGMCSGFISIVR